MSNGYHGSRFTADHWRAVLWKALYRYYFSKLIRPDDCVVDLGCGYGDFINSVCTRRRIAIDVWPDFPRYLNPGVEAIVSPLTDLSAIPDGTIDFALASNVFEHLSQAELRLVLEQLVWKLAPDGTLNIIQPNYRYAYREYFDDYTHVSVYSHISLTDYLSAHGFHVIACHPRFLPLTIKSRLPISSLLIRGYLLSPIKPFGKQMLLRARPRRTSFSPRG